MAIITPKAQLSFPHFAKPQQPVDEDQRAAGQEPKFGGVFVFTPALLGDVRAALKPLEEAAIAAGTEFFGREKFQKMLASGQIVLFGGKGSTFRTDGAEKYGEGAVYIQPRTKTRPGFVYPWAGPDGKPAVVPLERIELDFYPGAIVRASVGAFGYDKKGNKGVSFGLNNVQKLGDGPRLDNRVAATDEFEPDAGAVAPADLSDLGAE